MVFDLLIWGGAALTLAGLAGIVWCIVMLARHRRAGTEEAEMRGHLKTVFVVNMAALAASILGLMLVVLGIVFGP